MPHTSRPRSAPRGDVPVGIYGVLGHSARASARPEPSFWRASNPAQYVRRPQVHPSSGQGLDRSELGVFLFIAEQYDRAHAALAVLLGMNGLRVSEACATNVEDLGIERGAVHPHMLRAAFIMAALDAGVPLRDVQLAARHADPRTTTIYDHRRQNIDRHAAYVGIAFVAGG